MSEEASGAAPSSTGLRYPAHWEADVVLRDGVPMHIRPIRTDDDVALQAMHQRQSSQSQYFRFFAPMDRLSARDLHRFTHVDHHDRVALVLTRGADIVAVGRFDRLDENPTVAEVAFYVSDAEHGRGLGSVLLEHLAAAGRERGIARFTAEVLPANSRMIRVFRDAGYDVSQVLEDGILQVDFQIEETGRSWAVMAEREQHAESRSMRALLAARSVVVIGLGGPEQVYAERAAAAIRAGSFAGPVHVVALDGDPAALDSLDQLEASIPGPDRPELAVVAGEARAVVDVVPHLAELGVHALVVLSSGFAEQDEAGRLLQAQLLQRTRTAGIRLLGPASYGLVATGPAGRLDAVPRAGIGHGSLGLFCQSAASGGALLAATARRGVGVRSFVSAGNRADISGNDTLQAWQDDPEIGAAVVNLESIGNARKFSRIARRLSTRTPLVTVVSGQTGQQVPPGHTVRTSREPHRVLAQMLDQAGVIRARGTHEMLDLVQVFLTQPLPRGARVAVVGNSPALTSTVEGAARSHGLEPASGGALHPLATAEDYATRLAELGGRDDWDALVVVHAPPLGGREVAIARVVAAAAARTDRPVLASIEGLHGLTPELTAAGRVVPAYATGSDAVAALAGAVTHARWRVADRGELLDPSGIAPARARELLAPLLDGLEPGQTRRLDPDHTAELLACYGLSLVPSRAVSNPEEAVAAAEELSWPVALKTRDEVLRHRADLGGVRLDLRTPDELRAAMAAMTRDLESVAQPDVGFDVQAMAPPGVACVVRGTEDDVYGPVVSFGLGGDAVELLDDVAYRVPPLTDVDVAQMVRSPRAAPRLFGHRGLPVQDTRALENVVARVSVLTDDLPEVREVRLNPVLVGRRGAAVLAAVVEISPPWRADSGRRVLPGP